MKKQLNKGQKSDRKNLRAPRRLATLALLLFLASPLWSQTDYSGTYYIGSVGYNAGTPANNFYLCPTEGWCFYQPTNDFTGTDNGMPFLTTFKCKAIGYDATKAVWMIEKAPAPNSDYYYIKQALTGRYLVSNGTIRTTNNADRMRVHLETVASGDLDDKELFTIEFIDPYYVISPKGVVGGAADRKWLVVNGGNKNALTGQSGKTGGPTGYQNTAGIIGIYTKDDANVPFYLEPAISIADPVITNNFDGTFTITAAAGATIYYTTDGTAPTTSTPTSGTSPINITQTESLSVIKAMAKHPDDNFPTAVTTYTLPVCKRPSITVDNSNNVTITCATLGASIYYTDDNTEATSSSTPYSGSFNMGNATIIRAIAIMTGYYKSAEGIYSPPVVVHSSSEIDNMYRHYILASDFSSTAAIGTELEPFQGSIDGQMNVISGLDHPLVAYADGAVIKNVILDNVSISGGTNVGAICNEALGDTRIYNCGVLATGSSVEKDEDGYDEITTCSSTISGSGYVGGIVGLLDGSSRVINCFSYANVSGGTHVGGIVGYNAFATTTNNLKTMVMNCMFYGEVSGSSIAPIYNGLIITNDGDANGVNNFNYFRLEASYIQNTAITKEYNCALGAETRFLQRFEFFRHLLNSNRELAAWWATGDVGNKDEMMKWVMEPTQIGTSTPYPVLKTPGKYASVVNYTPSETAYDEDHRNEGRKLTSVGDGGVLHVTIRMGDGAVFDRPFKGAANAATIITSSVDLTITDKDFEHFNFNYGKVQLPYYNDFGTQNYRDNRVVTGWKIVSITGGTAGNYSTGDNVTYTDGVLTATPYNFADRHCTNKDLYDSTETNGSDRVFNQGAYWDVPEGVTAITIQPYWGKAVYLADAYWDVTYKNNGTDAMATADDVTTVGGGQRYENGVSLFNGQLVYTSMSNAISSSGSALFSGGDANNHTVYDYAVVLVGNYHQNTAIEASNSKPYTVTSVDLDGDNEPDYSFMLRFNGRTLFHPVRYDFLNLIGLGMAQKTTGGTGSYNLGIMQPKGWFEVTNTALFRVTQFEYSPDDRSKKPIILQGGVIEQWVTQQQDAGDKVSYFHVGGNVWFKEFHRGSHQDNAGKSTPHPPVSVTGGDFNKFYLTGLYQSQAAIYDDNAECYINGGRFGEVAGAGMEGIGTSSGKGNITWVIDHADIKEFYGGGINYAKPVHGNIHTVISNSHVTQFCGGPKFGDMEDGRTVTTTATGCTFGTYFGAGYGGNSYNRYAPKNQSNKININWNSWVAAEYKQSYNSTYGGVSTQIDYQFIPMSGNLDNVARLFVDYVGFSLATTHNVTSSLTGCTVTGNFYGGGSLGKVAGDVVSTLDDCMVHGNVFGAGYSASLPNVEVDSIGFRVEPYYYTDLGTYRTAEKGRTITYTWQQANSIGINKESKILYTTTNLDSLGTVTGSATLTLNGTTVGTLVAGVLAEGTGNVYGGGEESNVQANTEVVINGASQVRGSVFGAGKGKNNDYDMARVEGNSTVTIGAIGAPAVLQNVYGGGEMASVGTYTRDGEGVVTGSTDGKGTATVTINGGTVGPVSVDPILFVVDEHLKGDVFGGGLGEAGKPNYAYVTNAAVTLNSGNVKGSVFGGGENGHVLKDAAVTIGGGTVGVRIPHRYRNISTDAGSSNPVYAGNVYGGGRGVDRTAVGNHLSETAGRVYGNTSVSVTNGQVHHSVYGGGSLASVGTYTLTEDATIYGGYIHNFTENTGNATVTISGGRIGPTWDELLYDEAGNSLVDANGDPLSSYTYGGATGADDTIAKNYECLGENEGMVYGSGRGVNYPNDENEDHKLYVEMAFTNNTTVTISGNAMVIGSVFGGGENGHVKGNTQVNIQGGTIGGIPLHHNSFDLPEHTSGHGHIEDHNDRDDELNFNNTGIGRSVFRGNVYGGGRGIDHTSGNPSSSAAHIFSLSAGRVYGNTEINITDGRVLHNVFGGGSIASVGTYIYPNNDFFDNPEAALSNTGKTTVNVSGGQIGVMGENEGFVYGGGRGIAGTSEAQVGHLSFVNETEVNISSDEVNSRHADIRAAVFGGGMNGHVLTNTQVNISGGVIGGKTAANYASGADSYDPTRFTAVPASVDTTIHGTAYYSGIYSGDTITRTDGTGPATVFLGNVYGGGRGVDTTSGANLSYTAGRVYGNTEVNITGGIIYHSVFGGGSIASVGNYEVYTPADTIADHGDEAKKASCYRLVAYQPKVLDTTDIEPAVGRHRNSYSGVATVHISGGRIGTNGRNNGRVFGSSRGMAGTAYRGLGYVNIAHVTISGGLVKGSVFGSGENGHVLDSTRVVVSGGHIGNGKRTDTPWLNHYIGNVYGGGRGLDREDVGGGTVSPFAGRVYRNTKVEISGGQIDHNVYGGGSLASVGRYRRNVSAAAVGTDNYNVITYADADSGICRVTISGGTIGIDGDENGHVYGSSRGTSVSGSDIRANLAYTAGTRVNIQSGATIKGSVFGGGESGHVQRDAHVNVSGGTIGVSPGTDYDGLSAAAKARYDLMGNVYGGGRGVDTVHTGDNVGYSMSAGYVRGRTYVTVTGTPTIHRNVYGGGSMGIVGNYGPYARLDFWQPTGDATPATHTHGTLDGGYRYASAYSNASNGTATVVIKGTVGTATDHDSYHYGGNVYGASRGQANDPSHDATLNDFYATGGFAEMAYVTRTHVIVDTAAAVYGNVYGGGENGHVDFAGTTVDILNGHVYGNVFGGGKGSAISPTAGIVDGPTTVNIGSVSQTTPIEGDAYGSYNTVEIDGDIFAGNDAHSSPLGTMTVNVYHTRHNASNQYPTTVPETMTALDALPHASSNFALHGIYGGGNLASSLVGNALVDGDGVDANSDGNADHVYDSLYITQRLLQDPDDPTIPSSFKPWPDTTRKSTVNIYNCDNTVMYVYGGGRAADTRLNEVTIEGGYVYKAFGGGNGDPAEVLGNPGANVLRTATINIYGGLIRYVFGGSNTQGEIGGSSSVVMEKTNVCDDELIGETFGAGNAADFEGDINITVGCGTVLETLYGGANEANIDGNVTLTVEGGVYTNVFGGSKGTALNPADITGNVTLNIRGGSITNAFGGSDVNGNIGGTITVNVDIDPDYSCADPLSLTNVYGGGRNAAYTPTDPSATGSNHSPVVNIKCGTVLGDVFGGAFGSGATCTSNPKVVMGMADGTMTKAIVLGNIYGGGSAAAVTGNTCVLMQSGTAEQNIFGGGLGTTASVSNNTKVGIVGTRTKVEGNVYGGGNAGAVGGNTDVYIGEKPE